MTAIDYKRILHQDPEPFKAHWDEAMTDDQYHALDTFVGSSSVRKAYKSAHSFHRAFFLGKQKPPTEAMKFGTIVHLAMLQGSEFKKRYVVMPEFQGLTADGVMSKQSKAAKEKRAEWLANMPPGAVIVTEEERDKIYNMIDSVLSHPRASQLLAKGRAEIPGFYVDPKTGLRLKFKPDFLPFNLEIHVDLKTTQSSKDNDFRRSVENLHYDTQFMMYDHGIEMIIGRKPKYRAWIAVESEGDFETAVHETGPIYDTIGEWKYRHCLERIRAGIDSGKWPQAQTEIQTMQPSSWYVQEFQLRGVRI